MQKLLTPVSKDNFEQNWKIADAIFRKAKKKYKASRISVFLTNLVFMLMSLLVANGFLYDTTTGPFHAFLEDIPYLIPLWKKLSSLFLSANQSPAEQVLITAFILYAACFVISGVVALLVALFYRPETTKLPTDTPKENAAKLLAAVKEARRCSNATRRTSYPAWGFFFITLQFILFTLFCIMELGSATELMEICMASLMKVLAPVTGSYLSYIATMTALFVPSLMIFALVLYVCYSLASMLMSFFAQFFHRCNVPYHYIVEAEYHYVSVDVAIDGMSNDEIKEALETQAEYFCQQGIELELSEAYKEAKDMYARAAHGGNASGMEHYARHWLITFANDPAKYWLKKCVATGNASKTAVKALRRLKWHRRASAKYIKK